MTRPNLEGLRILVVEDEVMVADETSEQLRKAGATVLGPATRLEQAEKIVGSGERIDIAVLDINLRGQMIYSLADELIARGVEIVFATGYDQFVMPERFAGIPRCEKPIRWEDLLRLLQRAAS